MAVGKDTGPQGLCFRYMHWYPQQLLLSFRYWV